MSNVLHAGQENGVGPFVNSGKTEKNGMKMWKAFVKNFTLESFSSVRLDG